MELLEYIMEAAQVYRVKPTGFVDESEFKTDKFKNHQYKLLQCIAKYTPLKRNSSTNGEIWEEFFLDNEFVLYSKKKTIIGKTERKIKTKVIDKRLVSENKDEIYKILFGDTKGYSIDNLDGLVNFIVSTDYEHRSKERINNIVKMFFKNCEEDIELKRKLYKIKPWLNSKVDTII